MKNCKFKTFIISYISMAHIVNLRTSFYYLSLYVIWCYVKSNREKKVFVKNVYDCVYGRTNNQPFKYV